MGTSTQHFAPSASVRKSRGLWCEAYKSERLLTVDPGWEGTGWALWTDGLLPAISEVFRPTSMHAALSSWREVCRIARAQAVRYVLLEGVELHRSARGLASTGRGDTFHLAMLVGAYWGYAEVEMGFECRIVPPSVWKGQMTDEMVDARLLRRLGVSTYRRHEAEAVALGLWARGSL